MLIACVLNGVGICRLCIRVVAISQRSVLDALRKWFLDWKEFCVLDRPRYRGAVILFLVLLFYSIRYLILSVCVTRLTYTFANIARYAHDPEMWYQAPLPRAPHKYNESILEPE